MPGTAVTRRQNRVDGGGGRNVLAREPNTRTLHLVFVAAIAAAAAAAAAVVAAARVPATAPIPVRVRRGTRRRR